MHPWTCALLITIAGAVGGVVNALLTDNGFVIPKPVRGIYCPGVISNILIGGLSAFSSWSFYGSGAGLDVTGFSEANVISLKFSALAGAFLVGVAGSKWITNEVDKRLLKETFKEATKKTISPEECEQLTQTSPRRMLENIHQHA